MGNIHIERRGPIMPTHAQQIPKSKKCVRADQYCARPEQPILRKPLDQPEMLWRDSSAAQIHCGQSLRCERLVRTLAPKALHQEAYLFAVRSDINHRRTLHSRLTI